MPTYAVTTKSGRKGSAPVDQPSPAQDNPCPPLADHSGNGTIQVVAKDGSIVNVDGSAADWQDQVRALDPKHRSLPKD